MQGGFFAYWWRVIVRAFGDLKTDLSITKAKLVFTAILSAGTAFAGYLIGKEIGHEIKACLMGAVIWLVLYLAFLFFYALITPWKFDDERARDHKDMMAKIDDLAAIIKTGKERHSQEVVALNDSVNKARQSNPKLNAIRHQIEKYIASFKKIEQRVTTGEQIGLSEFSPLEMETADYVNRHLPEHGFSHQSSEEDSADPVTRSRAWVKKLANVLSFFN